MDSLPPPPRPQTHDSNTITMCADYSGVLVLLHTGITDIGITILRYCGSLNRDSLRSFLGLSAGPIREWHY